MERKPVDTHAFGLMLFVCISLGLQQVLLKMTAADISPLFQIALRSGVGAALIAAVMITRREILTIENGIWKPGLLVGLLFALEYLFLGEGLRLTSATRAVVLLYTAPIFAALGLHLLVPSERLTPMQWGGIGIAFAGIAIAFLLRGATVHGDLHAVLFGDALCLLAGVTWGATTIVVRGSRLAALPARQTLLYQLLIAFVTLSIASIVMGQAQINWSGVLIGSFTFQAFIVSFAVFLVWFHLLRLYRASQLGSLSFMTPIFGVILSAVILDEPIEASFVVGTALVITGLMVVNGKDALADFVRRYRRS
ncbi:DMT family transporter [Falsochrobactrum sp. TDYN1]|uniref:DMT family transporter n=1 Tax=Falsochrobactrum tianjinense TaxID=2706015 RepID=A0A949PJS9_9HYPH|nr:DMT family transporter [Falsochrobactrum sp. TDYN1]MBV2141938.1 DMT family transporter [Falsochrobactrum sp. TDYN1]